MGGAANAMYFLEEFWHFRGMKFDARVTLKLRI